MICKAGPATPAGPAPATTTRGHQMDPIDHRHAEWQHALHGDPAPAPQPGPLAPALLLGFFLLAGWFPALLGALA